MVYEYMDMDIHGIGMYIHIPTYPYVQTPKYAHYLIDKVIQYRNITPYFSPFRSSLCDCHSIVEGMKDAKR
jgi:hypothetical protein